MAEITLPKLRVSREEADKEIQTRIEKGQQLRDREIYPYDELEDSMRDFHNWSEYNEKLLLRLFDNSSMVDEYNRPYDNYDNVESWNTYNMGPNIDTYRRDITTKIKRLEGIRDQLELYDEPPDVLQRISGNKGVSDTPQSTFGDEVFIVHGHDDEAKVTVARFVENLGIEATILHERANRGQTIPEKFEEHADEAGFAIILLTPDDVGASQDEANNLKPRARQNVVLELGYFWGRLGRERMCVLYKEGVELPSDIHGILYVLLDSFNGWQLQLAREMQQAGLPIDLNKLV